MKKDKKEPVKQLQSFYSREKSGYEASDDQSLFIGPGTGGVALLVTFNARNFLTFNSLNNFFFLIYFVPSSASFQSTHRTGLHASSSPKRSPLTPHRSFCV